MPGHGVPTYMRRSTAPPHRRQVISSPAYPAVATHRVPASYPLRLFSRLLILAYYTTHYLHSPRLFRIAISRHAPNQLTCSPRPTFRTRDPQTLEVGRYARASTKGKGKARRGIFQPQRM
jgi:hypothetical protein